MHEYILIINQLRNGTSLRGLAREQLADRKTLRRVRDLALAQGWLEQGKPMPTEKELASFFQKNCGKSFLTLQPYREKIEEWSNQGVQASTIYAHLQREHGFKGSYSVVQRFIKSFKDKQRPVTTILDFKPGESAQVDFGQGPKMIDEQTGEEQKTWIFVMVLSWSRHMYAEIVLHQDVMTWLACHRRAFEWFNGVPGKIIIDNAKCAITKACYHNPCVQRAYGECASGYGFIISPCPPYDPQKKGRVESGVKYVKNRFVPLRQFRNLHDANQQLKGWLMQEAGQRVHGTTQEKTLSSFICESLKIFFIAGLPKGHKALRCFRKRFKRRETSWKPYGSNRLRWSRSWGGALDAHVSGVLSTISVDNCMVKPDRTAIDRPYLQISCNGLNNSS